VAFTWHAAEFLREDVRISGNGGYGFNAGTFRIAHFWATVNFECKGKPVPAATNVSSNMDQKAISPGLTLPVKPPPEADAQLLKDALERLNEEMPNWTISHFGEGGSAGVKFSVFVNVNLGEASADRRIATHRRGLPRNCFDVQYTAMVNTHRPWRAGVELTATLGAQVDVSGETIHQTPPATIRIRVPGMTWIGQTWFARVTSRYRICCVCCDSGSISWTARELWTEKKEGGNAYWFGMYDGGPGCGK
jgi:hypothetical protein